MWKTFSHRLTRYCIDLISYHRGSIHLIHATFISSWIVQPSWSWTAIRPLAALYISHILVISALVRKLSNSFTADLSACQFYSSASSFLVHFHTIKLILKLFRESLHGHTPPLWRSSLPSHVCCSNSNFWRHASHPGPGLPWSGNRRWQSRIRRWTLRFNLWSYGKTLQWRGIIPRSESVESILSGLVRPSFSVSSLLVFTWVAYDSATQRRERLPLYGYYICVCWP